LWKICHVKRVFSPALFILVVFWLTRNRYSHTQHPMAPHPRLSIHKHEPAPYIRRLDIGTCPPRTVSAHAPWCLLNVKIVSWFVKKYAPLIFILLQSLCGVVYVPPHLANLHISGAFFNKKSKYAKIPPRTFDTAGILSWLFVGKGSWDMEVC
jgi:hypothetical protein